VWVSSCADANVTTGFWANTYVDTGLYLGADVDTTADLYAGHSVF
jgi:hypothetical protein